MLLQMMELGHPSRLELLPLERLTREDLDEIALAIKARCLAELPASMAAKMDLQRREKKRLRKEEIQRDDKRRKALAQLIRYAGPELVPKAENLDEIKFEIAPEGGGPPNLGVQFYVSELMK